jgi:gamma-glutamyltranspeptidase/glutathione hydrolase
MGRRQLLSRLLFIAAALGCSSSPGGRLEETREDPASAAAGMVSTAHPLATEAGVEILRSGGSAFDAAVAVAATLSVVEPMMSGIGGYGTIVTYDARTDRARFLNCSGRIPKALDSDMFRPPTPDYEKNRRGAKAVSTPGNLNAWEALHQEYGTLEWGRLFDAAIEAADKGFVIGERSARLIESAFASFPPHAQLDYGRNGKPLTAGDRLLQKDLAQTLRRIAADGAGIVHGGPVGQAIDQAMRNAGGFLSLQDLKENQAEWWDPIGIDYRGFRVVTASPPSTAFPSLVRLGMMSRLDNQKLGHNSVGYLHHFAEVTKHAFWTRLRYAADPDISSPPLNRLLSDTYWDKEVDAIDAARARPFEYPTETAPVDSHTTHFVVADQWGNLVSATQTLGNSFGSRIMAKGTGVWLNNSLAYCTFEPKDNPMDAFPGRHKLSGDCPTLIFRAGKPWVAIGTPGGHTIGQTVPQMVMNLIDFDMDIQEAIAAPRVSFIEPDTLAVEEGIASEVRDRLAAMGHKIRVVSHLGNAHGLTIEYGAGGKPVRFTGAADPRGEGLAKGF